VRQGLKRIAVCSEKHTKTGRKERPAGSYFAAVVFVVFYGIHYERKARSRPSNKYREFRF